MLAINKLAINNFLFDFDGTLVNSGEAIYHYFVQNFAQKFATKGTSSHFLAAKTLLGQSSLPQWQELRGYSISEMIKVLGLKKSDLLKLVWQMRRDYHKISAQFSFHEGMIDVLAVLKNEKARLFLCTSNSATNVEAFLMNYQLTGIFEDIVGKVALFDKAKAIKNLMVKHTLLPEKSIYIGDEIRDIIAARKAGIKSVAVSWGYNTEGALIKHNPDYLIHRSEDLLGFITKTV